MDDRQEPNPFESPQASLEGAQSSSSGAGRRVLLVLLGIILVPIATFVAGFCCCFSVAMVGENLGGGGKYWIVVMFAAFILGGIAAGVGVIYGLVKLSRYWQRGSTQP